MNKKAEIKNRIDLINRGEVPEGYKKVHGYIIPNDWNIVPIKKIARQVKRSVEKPSESYYRLSVRSHAKGTFHSFVENPETVAMEELFQVKENDLIVNITFAWEHAIAIVKKEDNNLLVSHRFPTYEFNSNASVKFYENIIKLPKIKKMLSDMSPGGAGRNRVLNQTDFYNSLYIPYTNFKEQEKIAKILKCCDKVIELKEKLLEEKLNEKKYLMDKTFSKKYENNYQLKNLGTTFIGLSNKNKKDFGYGKPYIPYINIFNNTFVDASKLEYVNILQNENQATVKYGDIFFTTSSECPEEVGMTSVWLHNLAEVYLNSFCFGYRLNDFKILIPEYAGYYFRSPNFRVVLNKLAQGVTRFNLSKNNLMEERISLPSLEKQKQIAKIFLKIDKQIKLIQQELEQYKQLKKSLSQLLLTGIVRTVEVDCEN